MAHSNLFNKTKIGLLLFCNMAILAYSLHYFVEIPLFLLGLLINLLILIVPGLAWIGAVRYAKTDIASCVFFAVLISTVISIVGVLGFFIVNIQVNSLNYFIYLIIATNAGLFMTRISDDFFSFAKNTKLITYLCLIAVIVYVAVFYSSNYLVHPREDDDVELQGTAYGMIHYLKPQMLTDRGSPYYFAHPLISHLYSADAFLLTESLDEVKYYYDASERGIEKLNEPLKVNEEIPFLYPDGKRRSVRITGINQGIVTFDRELPSEVEVALLSFIPKDEVIINESLVKNSKIMPIVEQEYLRFNQKPYLYITRMPYFLLASLSGIVLFLFLMKIVNSSLIAFLGTLLYFSFPEILFLSAGEMYSSLTSFCFMMCIFCYWGINKDKMKKNTSPIGFLVCAFAALSNHKILSFPIAVFLNELIHKEGRLSWGQRFHAAFKNKFVLGFGFGSLLFWIYGYSIDPQIFYSEHIRDHFWDRIFHIDFYGYNDYPTFVEIWRMYVDLYSLFFMLMAVVAIIIVLKNFKKYTKNELFFPIWGIVGAIMFSVIDWRQTRHLSLIIPALLISIFICSSKQKQLIKRIWYCGLLICLIRNLVFMSEGLVRYNLTQ